MLAPKTETGNVNGFEIRAWNDPGAMPKTFCTSETIERVLRWTPSIIRITLKGARLFAELVMLIPAVLERLEELRLLTINVTPTYL